MIEPTFLSPKLKTRSTISCSTSCTSPSSVPSLIIALISSSVTFPSSLGFMPNNFKTKAVLFVNNITNGAAIFDIKYIGLDTIRATRSAAAIPIRLGTSSPMIKVR